jgi:hypothetical protein
MSPSETTESSTVISGWAVAKFSRLVFSAFERGLSWLGSRKSQYVIVAGPADVAAGSEAAGTDAAGPEAAGPEAEGPEEPHPTSRMAAVTALASAKPHCFLIITLSNEIGC